jgi:nitrite reductase/ring-hydroxylating ferredoxin subunit
VICPLHAWKFDLKTGEPIMATCGIKTYPARLNENNQVVLTLRVKESREAVM